jgi:hypothetical protein
MVNEMLAGNLQFSKAEKYGKEHCSLFPSHINHNYHRHHRNNYCNRRRGGRDGRNDHHNHHHNQTMNDVRIQIDILPNVTALYKPTLLVTEAI